MSTPDVRIRLSAEGVAEVVAALRKVQNESGSVAARGGKSFTGFNSVLGSTSALLGQLGVALSVGALMQWVRGAVDAAEETSHFAENLGTTTQRASALAYAAGQADVEVSVLAASMAKMRNNIGGLLAGSAGAEKLFRSIGGLSAESFRGKDTAEALALIAKGLSTVRSDYERGRIAQEIFGKGSFKLTGLLNDLSTQGLDGIVASATEAGAVLSDDVAAALRQTNDQIDALQRQAKTLTATFVAELTPASKALFSELSGGAGGTTGSMATIAALLGRISSLSGFLATNIWDLIATLFSLREASSAVAKALSGDIAGAFNDLKLGVDEEDARFLEFIDRFKGRRETLKTALKEGIAGASGAPGSPTGTPGADELAAAAARNAKLATAAADAELQVQKAKAKLLEIQDKSAYDQGLISQAAYYKRRREAIDRATEDEITALRRRLDALPEGEDQTQREIEAAKIRTQIVEAGLTRQADLERLNVEEINAANDLREKGLKLEQQMLDAEGERREAAMLGIEAQVEEAKKLWKSQGFSVDQIEAGARRLRDTLTQSMDFDAAQQKARGALEDISVARAGIEAEVNAGLLTQFEGEQKIAQLEQSRLDALRRLWVELMAVADASGNPEQIRAAHEFANAVAGIAASASRAELSMKNLQDAAEQAALSSLTNFLADGATNAENFGDAMLGLAADFAKAIQRMLAAALAAKLLSTLGINVGTKTGGYTGGQIRRLSGGGQVRGPGTSTSDSIPFRVLGGGTVWVSDEEFVTRAAVVRQPGALQFLHAFNTFGMEILKGIQTPRFSPQHTARGLASGGIVGSAVESAVARQREGRIGIGLEPGLVIRELDNPDGHRFVLRALAANTRAAQEILK